jgi:hypothetical protein
MQTNTRLQNYHNEQETERNTDVATIRCPYMGHNLTLRTKEQIEKRKYPTVECYYSGTDDVWYARLPAIASTSASDWVRANPANLKGLMEL